MTSASRRTRRLAVAVAFVVTSTLIGFGPSTRATAAEPAWTVVELQPLAGDTDSVAGRIDDSGRTVGLSDGYPVRWNSAGVPTALPIPEGCTHAGLAGLGRSGDALGIVDCAGTIYPVLWPSAGGAQKLAAPGFVPSGITDDGVIAGSVGGHAALWVPGYGIFRLQDEGCVGSEAMDITNAGLVVGTCYPGGDRALAIGWYGAYVFPLFTGAGNSTAVDASDAGVVLLRVYDAEGTHGWFVSNQGAVRMSGDLAVEQPWTLNEGGIAVASSGPVVLSGPPPTPRYPTPKVYIYGTSIDLNSLLPDPSLYPDGLGEVGGINNRLEMVGFTELTKESPHRAWLLRPPGVTG